MNILGINISKIAIRIHCGSSLQFLIAFSSFLKEVAQTVLLGGAQTMF
jgi:hypothetical protein